MVSNSGHLGKTSKEKLGYVTLSVAFVLFLNINASCRKLVVLDIPLSVLFVIITVKDFSLYKKFGP